MTTRETVLYALIGFSVWLIGAVSFRIGGRFLFESGPVLLVLSSLSISSTVCFILRSVMNWRKAAADRAVEVAVVMITPGLFAEVARLGVFSWATGLSPDSAGRFAAVMIFSTAVLLVYAMILTGRADRGHDI